MLSYYYMYITQGLISNLLYCIVGYYPITHKCMLTTVFKVL